MTYFADLTPYAYFPAHAAGEINVGWLDTSYPFPTGVTSPDFRVHLTRLCATQMAMLTRGFHCCPFCPERVANGSAEIRVVGPSGTIYAAPQLIGHYVEVHDYLPPEDFISGVMNTPEGLWVAE